MNPILSIFTGAIASLIATGTVAAISQLSIEIIISIGLGTLCLYLAIMLLMSKNKLPKGAIDTAKKPLNNTHESSQKIDSVCSKIGILQAFITKPPLLPAV